MKKIKVREEKKVVAKEFNPVEFFNKYKRRIIRICELIVVVIFSLLGILIWQGNQRSNAITVLTQARDLFSDGKYEASISMYKQFLKRFPRHRLSPVALLGIGYCYEELGVPDEAKKFFMEVRDRFPDSPWAEDARKGLERLG